MTQLSQLDKQGYFVGVTKADPSPLEPGVYLIPGGAIKAAAPIVPEGKRAKWNGAWVFENIPQSEGLPEPTPEEIAESLRIQKQFAYQREADPLFFKWQAGEGTKEEWEARRAEIKARYL